MASRFTLGVEEEFQMVDKQTGELASSIDTILEKGTPRLGHKIKPEMLQSAVETITGVCPNIAALRLELQNLRTTLTQVVDAEGLALISAGTHPTGLWQQQISTRSDRHTQLKEEFQDVGRSILIFAVHVHVGIEKQELAIPLMNQLRTWLPHMLAISANSPFWAGRYSGLRSYRAIVWRRFPRSGVPVVFEAWSGFNAYVQSLIKTGCIDNGKRIWWDLRPHPYFNTLEFRVFDMPATFEDTMAIAALCQALVAKLAWMYKRNLMTPVLPSYFIDENKWRAARYGLDAEVVDFVHQRRIPMRDSINELLDFVDDVLDDLNDRREINYLRSLLENPQGTGADRQIAVYKETGSVQDVTRYLMQQTMQGLTLNAIR
jgi:carboxylate-amine ligase